MHRGYDRFYNMILMFNNTLSFTCAVRAFKVRNYYFGIREATLNILSIVTKKKKKKKKKKVISFLEQTFGK